MAQPIILVADDESVLGHDLCDTVQEAGYAVAGPFSDAGDAMKACDRRRPDVVILDVNRLGDRAYILADRMIAEDVPVIFHSGDGISGELRTLYPNSLAVTNPCPPARMIETVQQVLAAS